VTDTLPPSTSIEWVYLTIRNSRLRAQHTSDCGCVYQLGDSWESTYAQYAYTGSGTEIKHHLPEVPMDLMRVDVCDQAPPGDDPFTTGYDTWKAPSIQHATQTILELGKQHKKGK